MAIAWNSNPAAGAVSYASTPSADFNLVVRDPDGVKVAQSLSKDNTYELVDFTTGKSGTYTIQIIRNTCTYSPDTMGVAWYNRTP